MSVTIGKAEKKNDLLVKNLKKIYLKVLGASLPWFSVFSSPVLI